MEAIATDMAVRSKTQKRPARSLGLRRRVASMRQQTPPFAARSRLRQRQPQAPQPGQEFRQRALAQEQAHPGSVDPNLLTQAQGRRRAPFAQQIQQQGGPGLGALSGLFGQLMGLQGMTPGAPGNMTMENRFVDPRQQQMLSMFGNPGLGGLLGSLGRLQGNPLFQ